MIDYDSWCVRCKNYSFSNEKGIVCALTCDKPSFENTCENFQYDAIMNQKLKYQDTRENVKNQRLKSWWIALFAASFVWGSVWYYFIRYISFVEIIIFIAALFTFYRWKRYENIRKKHPTAKLSLSWYSRFIIKNVKEKHINKWISTENYIWLGRIYEYGDYHQRFLLVMNLQKLPTYKSREILIKSLDDQNFKIVQEAIHSLEVVGLKNQLSQDKITELVHRWEIEEKRIQDNLNNSDYSQFSDKYIDKDSMHRLKQAKELLMKFRGSMSIG